MLLQRRPRCRRTSLLSLALGLCPLASALSQELPFKHKIETYRDKDDPEVAVFSLALEQPFLAEEFERSNFLRLRPLDDNAYLTYPKETRFQQKAAVFYGRLRGAGKAALELSYDTVTENLDGSRRVETRTGRIEVAVPAAPGGPQGMLAEWARQQNDYFLDLLGYYPDETFLQYCLLQSKARYGVQPRMRRSSAEARSVEEGLYQAAAGALAIQQQLQHETLSGEGLIQPLDTHISQLTPPDIRSPDYQRLVKELQEEGRAAPAPGDPGMGIAALVPHDYYLLQLASGAASDALFDLLNTWGRTPAFGERLARDDNIEAKFERQLCLRRAALSELFAQGAITEAALAGADISLSAGADLTVLLGVTRGDEFDAAVERWVNEARELRPDLTLREFNYRGEKVLVRYTDDRAVSSFSVRRGDYAIFSNSHAAIRDVVDTFTGKRSPLAAAEDYRYVTAMAPPPTEPDSGRFFVPEAFLRRQVSPATKITERRRKLCFNNLVMLNNASLFYRLENGRSPASLGELAAGRFVDPERLACPHGGAYAYDAGQDLATCSLHNRLKLLTPNIELETLKVSGQERAEYGRYKERFGAFWQGMFNPIAVNFRANGGLRLESCVLPFANCGLDEELAETLAGAAVCWGDVGRARSAVLTVGAALGQQQVADLLRAVPGVPEALASDPTLTDLSWIGDRVALSLCDADTIVEIDPTQLRPLMLLGNESMPVQGLAALALTAMSLPAYAEIDVRDHDKAARLLDLLASRAFLQSGALLGMPVSLDAYNAPDYAGVAVRVLSVKWYAATTRLHLALLEDRLVVATTQPALCEAIDAAGATSAAGPRDAGRLPQDARQPHAADPPKHAGVRQDAGEPSHLLARVNVHALDRLREALEAYWGEQTRVACHGNLVSIQTLARLYGASLDETQRLADAKYGVTYLCPEGGHYTYDAARDVAACDLHGTRRDSRQPAAARVQSPFSRLLDETRQIELRLRRDKRCQFVVIELGR